MSLIETYQGRKSLFAQKLITKGVTASATDGLTTLINKIDDIGDTFSGLLLNGDKSIAQRGDTVTLSMMLLDDAELQYNTDVTLYENTFEHTYSSATTINEDIGEDYEIVIHSGSFRICGSGVTPANGAVIQLNNNYLIGYNNGNYMISPRTTGTNRYRIKNGVLSYGNTSLDLSSYDIDFSNLKECIEAGKVTVYTSTVVNTGSDGVATYDYTCTGVGEKTFFAKSGIFQSETYSLWDILFYDEATSNAKWNTNYANVTLNRELVSNGTKLSYTADSGTRYCNTLIEGVQNWFDSTKAYQVDFDILWERNSDCAVGVGIGNNGYNIHNHFSGALSGSGHYKIITDGATYQFYLDDVKKGTPVAITGNTGFFFSVYRTGSITFSNLKIQEI